MRSEDQIIKFLANFGYQDNLDDYKSITLKRYDLILRTASRWHGHAFACMVADCFMPEGEAVDPGYEDSCSHYFFMGVGY